MKNQTQTVEKNAPRDRRRQARPERDEGMNQQLPDRGAIFFDSAYDDIREKSFDEAICMFKALLELIQHHPGMKDERAALRLIVRGDEQLQNCQSVKRARALCNYSIPHP